MIRVFGRCLDLKWLVDPQNTMTLNSACHAQQNLAFAGFSSCKELLFLSRTQVLDLERLAEEIPRLCDRSGPSPTE